MPVAGATLRLQSQSHAKTRQQQNFTKTSSSQPNSATNQKLATSQAVNNLQSFSPPLTSISKTSLSTLPIDSSTFMDSSNYPSSSFESGVILSGSSGCCSLSNSPTSSSTSSNSCLTLQLLRTASKDTVSNQLCVNTTHLEESCPFNTSVLAVVNDDVEHELVSKSLSETLYSNYKDTSIETNQQILVENIQHQQHSATETSSLNTEDVRTLQLAVELTMMNINQMSSSSSAPATTTSSSSTTTNHFEQQIQSHRFISSQDQPYSSPYTSVYNPYHMTTKVFLQTQSHAATTLNQKHISENCQANSSSAINPSTNRSKILGTVTTDDRSKKSQNMTECVPVPSSEHVAEIVGRQGM